MKPIRAIEDIREGDEVLADDPDDTEPASAHKVSQVHRNWTKRLIHVAVDNDRDGTADGEVLATGEHPFWTKSRGWVFAKDLTGEDELLDEHGQFHRVVSAKSVPTVCPTFNLSIEGTHTYFVLAGRTPVLVHNAYEYQVGTYGSLNGGANIGDGFFAHEPLPNAWLRANGYASGVRLSQNPAIALTGETHGIINGLQETWGIKNADILRSITAEEALEANLRFMQEARVPNGPANQVTENALKFAEQLPCP